MIRVDGKSIFIAECKFWEGPKAFTAAIDQLLGYAAWRDTKIALLVFNRNQNSSAVVEQIPNLVKAHPNFVRQTPYKSQTGFRFVVRRSDDVNREMLLTVLVFDIPRD